MLVNLRAKRKNSGLSAQQAAREMGVSRQVLLNAELGRNIPQPANAAKIANFYNLDTVDVWPEDDTAVEAPAEATA